MATDLPVSQGQTFNIRPIANIQAPDTTPAIAAMQNAVARGALDFSTIADHFSKATRESEERAKMKQAAKEREDEDLIRPAKTAAKLKELESQVAELKAKDATTAFNESIRPKLETAAEGAVDLKVTALKDIQSARETANAALSRYERDLGAPDPDVASQVNFWLSNYDKLGPVPITEVGQLDLDGLKKGLATARGFGPGSATKLTESQKMLLDTLPPELRNEAFDPKTGELVNDAALVALSAKAATSGRPLSDAQRSAEMAKLADIKEVSDQLAVARTRINDQNIVGPLRGSGIGRAAAMLETLTGFPAVQTNQDRLTHFLNTQILQKASLMKGQLSDKDVMFLKQSVPTLDKPESTWLSYLDETEQFLARRKAAAEAFLGGDRSVNPATPAATAPTPGLAGAATGPGSKAEPLPVANAGAYATIKSGQWYQVPGYPPVLKK